MHRTHSFFALLALALFSISVVTASSAQAGVPLVFSGGSGAPLSITLSQPVSYTITNDFPPYYGPNFTFQGTGDVVNDTYPSVTSTIGYSVDGGPVTYLQYVNSGVYVDSIMGDLYANSSPPVDISIGSVVTLTAGTMTTTTNIAAAAPANGDYETWITASNGYTISTNGVVPEPASLSLLALAGIAITRRRRG